MPAGRAFLVLIFAGSVVFAGAPTAAPLAPYRPAGNDPVQLVESVPVESDLGNPALPSAASVWVYMIDEAKRELDLEQFYLSVWPNERMGPVLDAIGRAAKRGVRVRLLLDAGMLRTYPAPADSLGRIPGIRVRKIDMKKVSGGGIQHAKYFVVDDNQVYVGSQNFDWRSLKHIHELGVRVHDPQIAGLYDQVFESDWQAAAEIDSTRPATHDEPAAAKPIPSFPIRVVQAPGDTAEVWATFSPRGHIPAPELWDRDLLVRLLDQARSSVVVQSLTYGNGRGPERDSTLDEALRRAAGRGVKVRLLISDWEADSPRIADLQRLSQVPGIEVKLGTVPEWGQAYIPFARVEHCKYMVVDSLWTWVGTSNWEPSYFTTSRNGAITTRNRPIAAQAMVIFETSWSAAGTQAIRPEGRYEPKVHRETTPAGKTAYGK